MSGLAARDSILTVAERDVAVVESAMLAARDRLLKRQHAEGWWCAELEADTTLESYFILFKTLFGHRDDPKIPKLAKVIELQATYVSQRAK